MYHALQQLTEEEAQARFKALIAETLEIKQTYYYTNDGWYLDKPQDCSTVIEHQVVRISGPPREEYVVKLNNEVKQYCHSLNAAKLYAETYDVFDCSAKLDNSVFSDVKLFAEEAVAL